MALLGLPSKDHVCQFLFISSSRGLSPESWHRFPWGLTSFHSISPRRAGLPILARMTAVARRQTPPLVSTDRRAVRCLDHRQCLLPMTRLFLLDPINLLIYSLGFCYFNMIQVQRRIFSFFQYLILLVLFCGTLLIDLASRVHRQVIALLHVFSYLSV